VHSALLTGLMAATEYKLHVEVDNVNISSLQHWRFRTAPVRGHKVDLVLGGDMGSSDEVTKLMAISIGDNSTWPAGVLMGGDIAYDNGMTTCWPVWDDWLLRWDGAMRSAKRLVPLIFAVGNHDVGVEAVASTKPPRVRAAEIPYISFFPQHAATTCSHAGPANSCSNQQVPQVTERRPHHVHRIGDVLVLSLDSGYTEVVDSGSSQLNWASIVLQNVAPSTAVCAMYHVPIYPSTIEHIADWESGPSGAFAPFFDTHGVHLAFENHVHAFKRTVPLKSHRASEDGTVYLGDGRAGVSGLGVPDEDGLIANTSEPRLAVASQARNHVWLMNMDGGTISLRAIDPDGVVFDSYRRHVSAKTLPSPSGANSNRDDQVLV